MEPYYYVILAFFCTLLALLLYFSLYRTGSARSAENYFAIVILLLAALTIFDAFAFIAEENIGSVFWIVEGNISNSLYFVSTGFLSAFWFLHVAKKSRGTLSARFKALVMIPAEILAVLSITSPLTGLIFSFDGAVGYSRGILHPLQIIIVYGSLIAASVQALISAKHSVSRPAKNEFLSLALFSLPPVIGGLIQVVLPQYLTVVPSLAVGMILVFLNLQNKQISTDALTGINNRGRLDQYIENRGDSIREDEDMHMILLDVDRFKSINDTYGHAVGDDALKRVVSVLKNVCSSGRNDFAARFGGDEFAVVCVRPNGVGIEDVLSDITDGIARENETSGAPYKLSVSAGCSTYKRDDPYAADTLVAVADKNMYANKLRHYGKQTR